MGIIPVINCPDLTCVKEKIEKAKQFLPEGGFLHCDVADGFFTFHKTWSNPTEWANLRVPFSLEVHIMAQHPEKVVDSWLAAGAKRLIIPIEAVNESTVHSLIDLCKKRDVGLMLSSSPETPVEELLPFRTRVSLFQVLSVYPGPSAQKFLNFTLKKVTFLRKMIPNAIIEVDGGINQETAKLVKAAGADFAVSASYIFNSPNPRQAYEALNNV